MCSKWDKFKERKMFVRMKKYGTRRRERNNEKREVMKRNNIFKVFKET